MKKIAKQVISLALVAVLALSFAGCYDEDLTWAAERNGEKLPIGVYIYYLSTAYSEAAAEVPSDEKVLSAEIEGEPAEEWIRARAMELIDDYYWVDTELERLGVAYDEAHQAAANQTTESYWSLFQTTLEKYGVAKTSFHKAYSEYNQKYMQLFEALYGEGGEEEIPEAEIRAYFSENYYSYEFFSDAFSGYDGTGAYVDLTDEEKETLTERFNTLADEIEAGKKTVEEAATEYAEDADKTSSYTDGVNDEDGMGDAYLPEELIDAIMEMKEGEVRCIEASGSMVVVRRRVLADTLEESLNEGNTRLTIMLQLRGDAFGDKVEASASGVEGVTVNTRAIERVSLSKLTENGGSGTMETESSEAESSADEDDSAESDE